MVDLLFFLVSTHSHPKVAARVERIKQELQQVSTHSHPKVAAPSACAVRPNVPVSTHSHPKVAAGEDELVLLTDRVSTHSHPKVAAALTARQYCQVRFQHTATRRWLLDVYVRFVLDAVVSTHSHPKVAAREYRQRRQTRYSFNTQPPEGGCNRTIAPRTGRQSFNTQPPEGGCHLHQPGFLRLKQFQHTATRRWLPEQVNDILPSEQVSTHSHPKVAAFLCPDIAFKATGFNTQPPEGGCLAGLSAAAPGGVSTHSHPKVAAGGMGIMLCLIFPFQHTATRRWLRA